MGKPASARVEVRRIVLALAGTRNREGLMMEDSVETGRAVSGENDDPPGGPPLVGGFFLKCVFSRLAWTFNVAGRRMAGRCGTVFYVTPENMCR